MAFTEGKKDVGEGRGVPRSKSMVIAWLELSRRVFGEMEMKRLVRRGASCRAEIRGVPHGATGTFA